MAAYMIVTATLHDRDAFVAGYGRVAAELLAQFGGRYLLRALGTSTLEGTVPEGASVVISEWPDKAAALAFWNSPKYAEAKRLREGIADVEVLLIEAPEMAR